MPKPAAADAPVFYHNYISNVAATDLQTAFANNLKQAAAFLQQLPAEKAGYAYAPEKWTLRQLLQHMIDTERIFAFRALWFVRQHPEPVAGFDENTFAANAPAENRTIQDLISEFLHLHQSTFDLYNSFSATDLQRVGFINEKSITVNALGFIIIGHFLHHQRIITDRYL
jgi:uncharacterized damage-inducible protein DinB